MIIRLTYLVLFFYLITTAAFAQMAAKKETFSRYMFDQVHIQGKTNMNDFRMEYRDDNFCHVPSDFSKTNSLIEIEIPADQIEADSKIMLHDFLKLIHAKKYPTIAIEIDSQDIVFDSEGSYEEKTIAVSMNGISRQFTCSTYSDACFGNQWCLTGELTIKLTDFDIEPPTKFLGLVKVKDEIFISFRILFS
ncbi:YceI family protein [Sunxiuqinia sp. sy24]|uniref:YceI family protein n=1 Tax=Sunxiuqinia sp. sy24 TaxID=3461495 RepID=UPI00404603B9